MHGLCVRVAGIRLHVPFIYPACTLHIYTLHIPCILYVNCVPVAGRPNPNPSPNPNQRMVCACSWKTTTAWPVACSGEPCSPASFFCFSSIAWLILFSSCVRLVQVGVRIRVRARVRGWVDLILELGPPGSG